MADVAVTTVWGNTSNGWTAVSVNLVGTAITGTVVGDWITPLVGLLPAFGLIAYNEGTGTLSQVIVSYEVKAGGDGNIYALVGTGGAAYAVTVTADGKICHPIGPGTLMVQPSGITHIRASCVFTGNGAGDDSMLVMIAGRRTASS